MQRRGVTSIPHTLTTEVVLGRRWHIATYAHDPAVTFRAATAAEAVRQLEFQVAELHRMIEGPRFPTPATRRSPLSPR
jgi:hypothetical protein